VRRIFSAVRVAMCALCVFTLSGLSAWGQVRGGDKEQPKEHPNGIVQDWSRRHVAYPRIGSVESLIAVQRDPRALLSWQAAERDDWHRERRARNFRDRDRNQDGDHDRDDIRHPFHHDWSISLGAGSTAPAMYPAKFGFDTNAAPDCTNDFVVFPVNLAGSAIQPNLVAFNNLYSGGTSITPTGLCGSRTVVSGDNRSSATTLWSYDINAAGGLVATSPALSQDGQKVAFVETVAGSSAHFHVLAYKSGDGVDLITPNLQNALKPVIISAFTGLLAPAAGSGTASDLSIGATGDTLSSPFVDYNSDVAYVGNDAGVLFRIKNVFCTFSSCAGAAPSLDLTWNSTGSVTIGGTCAGALGKLTGPVVDSNTGHVFVGCADGKLYGFTSAGAPLATASISVGNGSVPTGGIVDPPLIDAVNKFVYAVSGSSAGASVIVQASTVDLSGKVIATLGAGALFAQHAPAFNAAYISSGTPANWLIYDWATTAANESAVYGVGFGAGHIMTGGPAGHVFAIAGSTGNELSPVTEFLNGATDQLFVSGIAPDNPNFVAYNINSFPTTFPPFDGSDASGATAAEGGGTSGIIVDNDSGLGQASSIYFGVLTTGGVGSNPNGNSAVKVTQSGLL
jgi:hypothetical protein